MLNLININVTLNKSTKLERSILNHLNLEIKEGEFIVVMGANGAGKSTMLNLISGFIKPDSGTILIAGQDVTNKSQTYRAHLVSKVIQDPKVGTMENMTIFENMAFALKRGQNRGLMLFVNQRRKKLFREKLSLLNMGLENRLDELVSNLSGGQRQALSLIMALLQEANILLLDEITAALDPASSDYIMELTNRLIRAQRRTCIMITHNIEHALRYGDRLLLLKDGAFIKDYSAADRSSLTSLDLIAQFNRSIT